MFRVVVLDSLGNNAISVFETFTHFEYCNKLSKYGNAKFCVSCDCPDLTQDFERMNVKNKVEIYCLNQGSSRGGKVFDGYVHTSHVSCDEICVELMDCLGRLDRRRIREDYKRTNIPAQQVIQEVFALLDAISPMPVALGNITDATICDEVSFSFGKSFLDILTEIAKKTGAEFRCCDGVIDFVLPDTANPNGTGIRQPGQYQYNPQNDNSVITDFTVSKTVKNFCNAKLSKDSDSTTSGAELITEDQASITECGLWECFESGQEGHDDTTNTECNELPQIQVDSSCDDRCDFKVGDRKTTIITPKVGLTYSFDAIFLEICVRCQGGDFDISYSMGSSNSLNQRPRTDSDYIEELEDRIETLEQNQ